MTDTGSPVPNLQAEPYAGDPGTERNPYISYDIDSEPGPLGDWFQLTPMWPNNALQLEYDPVTQCYWIVPVRVNP